ncbi:MAG: hypothetical protein M0Q93_12440 [Terrimicrobiaceae bacterium]|nr:hypothetical protein [Terrimicrobiaceae bacterium]
MRNETAAGSSGTPDGGRHRPSGGGECSPLQVRAPFLANWNWQSVVGINQRACARGGAQQGTNSETGATRAAEWEQTHQQALTLAETIDFLRACHRGAPFLFFNGNTFSFIGRELAFALFSDLPVARKREVGSAIAHYIAGVLDRDAMIAIVESLSCSASYQPGDRVKTLKGTLRGVIVKILDDGRVKWRADTGTEFLGLPGSLAPDD